MTRLGAALARHWFAPASLRELALARIVLVGAQLFFFLPSLESQRIRAGLHSSFFEPLPILKLLLLPFGEWGARPGPMFLQAIWLVTVIAGLFALVGRSTRVALLVLAAGSTALQAHNYSYGEYHHPQALMLLALWLLALSPAGAALSLDVWRRRTTVALAGMRFAPTAPADDLSPDARWPLRLIQWLFVLVYFSAGLAKVANAGLAWMNGHTLARYLVEDGLRHDLDHALVLAAYPALLIVPSIVAYLFELTFALAVLVPGLTWIYLLTGTGLHVGIYTFQRAEFFQFVVLYVVFIETLRRRTLLGRPRAPDATAGARWTVIYDGLCPLCLRSVVTLDVLDLRRALAYLDLEREWEAARTLAPDLTREQARAAMHVVAPTGELFRGFFAFRALARRLPLLWPLLPLLHAPLSGRLGPRIYDWIARRRARRLCAEDICAV